MTVLDMVRDVVKSIFKDPTRLTFEGDRLPDLGEAVLIIEKEFPIPQFIDPVSSRDHFGSTFMLLQLLLIPV